MRPDVNQPLHPQHVQTKESASTSPQGQRMNALRHGLRAKTLVLRREDAAAFERQRDSAYRRYRPLTPEEDRCVERIVACEWKLERWERWEQKYNDTLDDLLEEPIDGPTSQQRNPETHYWQHRSIDCTLQLARMERSIARNERRLYELQRLRRQGLLAGAEREAVADDVRAVQPEAHAEGLVPEVSGSAQAPERAGPSDCFPGGIGFLDDQKERGSQHTQWPRWTPGFDPVCVDSAAPFSVLRTN
ncbi:MAG TPA: hypothetical protein VF678_05530 [bacterium]